MIPEYKLYHGAVLAELVHELPFPVRIDELYESGRRCSYILESSVGVHVKHSTKRLHPWGFTFTEQNLEELKLLSDVFPDVFLVFVCGTHGMVSCEYSEFKKWIGAGIVENPWVRVDRKKGQWYHLTAPDMSEPIKVPAGLQPLLSAIRRLPVG